MNIVSCFNNFKNFQFAKDSTRDSLPVSNVSFKGKPAEKLLKKIMETDNIKKLKITFDEMVKMYEHLGYDVLMKRGSHAIVPVAEGVNIPLVIPHKDKVVNFKDIKRLKYIAVGDIENAKRA